MVVPPIWATTPCASTSCRMSSTENLDKGNPRRWGNSQARALTGRRDWGKSGLGARLGAGPQGRGGGPVSNRWHGPRWNTTGSPRASRPCTWTSWTAESAQRSVPRKPRPGGPSRAPAEDCRTANSRQRLCGRDPPHRAHQGGLQGVTSATAERAAAAASPTAGARGLARWAVRDHLPATIRGIASLELRNQQKRMGDRNRKAEFGSLAPEGGQPWWPRLLATERDAG